MGRENGAFVRSYERARPTAYDPRERPWYILAKEHPGEVMVTEPYSSVTTPDVNIGTVTALLDEDGEVYGVIGADITLVNLTEYLASIESIGNQEMILTDRSGTILASYNTTCSSKISAPSSANTQVSSGTLRRRTRSCPEIPDLHYIA